jgi:flavin-binding protein dodecin
MAAIYKHVTLTGEGPTIEGAIAGALAISGKAVTGHAWMEVVDIRASLGAGAAVEAYQVTVKIAFEVDESKVGDD